MVACIHKLHSLYAENRGVEKRRVYDIGSVRVEDRRWRAECRVQIAENRAEGRFHPI
jgi:hypothetical protein